MNTLVSALAMDYPPDKLSVYLSDDGAAPVTLYGVREASEFARVWVPFCKKYGIKSRCPKVFFSPSAEDEHLLRTDEFRSERDLIKVYISIHMLCVYYLCYLYICMINNLLNIYHSTIKYYIEY